MAAQKSASQVTPFAAMTLGDQNTRWLALHSQLLPYITAVPGKDSPSGNKSEPGASWRTGMPIPSQMPVFNSPPVPTRHGEYDTVHKRMDAARKQALEWHDISTQG